MALLWRATAPAVCEKGHPGKVGPSVGINLPKVVLSVVRYSCLTSPRQRQFPAAATSLSDILACGFYSKLLRTTPARGKSALASVHKFSSLPMRENDQPQEFTEISRRAFFVPNV